MNVHGPVVTLVALCLFAPNLCAASATKLPGTMPVLGGHLFVSVPAGVSARVIATDDGREPPPRVSRIAFAIGSQQLALTAVELFRIAGPDFDDQARNFLPRLEQSLGPLRWHALATTHSGLRLVQFLPGESTTSDEVSFAGGLVVANTDRSVQLLIFRANAALRAASADLASLQRQVTAGLHAGPMLHRYTGTFTLADSTGAPAFSLMVPEGLVASTVQAANGRRIRVDRVVSLGTSAGNMTVYAGSRPAPTPPPRDAARFAGILAGQRVLWRLWTMAGDSAGHRIYHAETVARQPVLGNAWVHVVISAVSAEERGRFLSLAATIRPVHGAR